MKKDIYFYWGNDTLIGSDSIAANTTASIYLPTYINPDWLEHGNYNPAGYDWYATANDTFDEPQSDDYWFNTSIAWDINEDRDVNYLDISLMATHYSEAVSPAGSDGWDINNDTNTNYLDISLLVSHYGDSY